MSRSTGSPREIPASDGRGERQPGGSDAPSNPAPVVTAMPLDPALVDLIAARVAAQLEGRSREGSGAAGGSIRTPSGSGAAGGSRSPSGSGALRSEEPPMGRGDLESGGKGSRIR